MFLTENKKQLLQVMQKEAAGTMSSSPQFKAIAKWLTSYNAISVFVKTNRKALLTVIKGCLLYTSPSPRDRTRSRMPSSA